MFTSKHLELKTRVNNIFPTNNQHVSHFTHEMNVTISYKKLRNKDWIYWVGTFYKKKMFLYSVVFMYFSSFF